MRFRSERDALVDLLSTAGRAVGTRSAAAVVLSGVMLSCEQNRLIATGTDLDLTIRIEEEVIGIQDGACVVPARLASDVVRSLEAGAVTVEAKEDRVEITAGRSRFSLRNFPVVEFPSLADTPGGGHLLGAELASGLRQVVRAASNDDARPLLTGVLMTTEDDVIRLVATDSYRLALRDLRETKAPSDLREVLIPARALAELQRLPALASTSKADVEVHMSVGANEVAFMVGSVEIRTRLLEGAYPDYRQLIPDDYPNRLHLGKESILGALRRVRLLVRDSTTPVRMSMRPGGVDLSVTSQDVGDATETVDGDFTGEDLVIAFNPSYLIDGIDAVDGDEVVIETADPGRPATVRAAEQDYYRYLLMPVRVS
ncbi:MAG: DNA polymerase III subunit beta [Acidimicrobiales bacterium]